MRISYRIVSCWRSRVSRSDVWWISKHLGETQFLSNILLNEAPQMSYSDTLIYQANTALCNMRAIGFFAHPTGKSGENRLRAISIMQASCQPYQGRWWWPALGPSSTIEIEQTSCPRDWAGIEVVCQRAGCCSSRKLAAFCINNVDIKFMVKTIDLTTVNASKQDTKSIM